MTFSGHPADTSQAFPWYKLRIKGQIKIVRYVWALNASKSRNNSISSFLFYAKLHKKSNL